MSKETRETKLNKFNWKLFVGILLLVALGALAKVPATIYVEGLVEKPEVWSRVTTLLFTQDFFIMGLVPAFIGLLIIPHIGLRISFRDQQGNRRNFGRILLEALIIAAVLAVIGLVIQKVTEPMISQSLMAQGMDPNTILGRKNPAPWWAMTLLSFSAGVVEEVTFRLGLLSLLAWLGSLIWKPRQGQLRPAVFWVANILIALIFAFAHFSNIGSAGISMGLGIILRTLSGNILAALVFGWLYWKRGLGNAMLTHFLLDFIIYVVLPAFSGLMV